MTVARHLSLSPRAAVEPSLPIPSRPFQVRDRVRWRAEVRTTVDGKLVSWLPGTEALVVASDDKTVTVRTIAREGWFADVVLQRHGAAEVDDGVTDANFLCHEGEALPLARDRRAGPFGDIAVWESPNPGVYGECAALRERAKRV